QMSTWVHVVRPRKFPYWFPDFDTFRRFRNKVLELARRYKLPAGRIVIQGSSLRTPQAKDVDVAIFVTEEEFQRYAEQCREGIRRRSGKSLKAAAKTAGQKEKVLNKVIGQLDTD